MSADPAPPTGLDRRDLLRLGGLILALLLIVGVVLLAGGAGGEEKTTTGEMTGVLTGVSETQLTLRTENEDTQTFIVRPEDRRNLDFFHLQQHSADALPSLVTYEQQGDALYVVRVDDA